MERNGERIELTAYELIRAFEEQEHIYDVQDIKDRIDDIIYYDVSISNIRRLAAKRIVNSPELLSACADIKRRNIDKYNMDWLDATDDAIETMTARIEVGLEAEK